MIETFLGVVLGLVLGSFANVVIYRLPRMLERQWTAAEGMGMDTPRDPFNLAVPGSHCPHCNTPLRWYENLPLLSFLWQRGRCRHCREPIGWRYPLVELSGAALGGWCFMRFGLEGPAVAWMAFGLTLVVLAAIDWDTTLLPDVLTQPLTWGGLVAAALGWSGLSLPMALWGAVGGYLCLWSLYWAFRLVTGKEGMGQGDFKLLAALGAWWGPWAGVSIILIASLSGLAVGLWLRRQGGLREGGYLPFGPFLALAGLWLLVFGPLPGL